MVNGMIVIPQEARALAVGIVVVLELARGNHIFCPAVPWRALGALVSVIILSDEILHSENGEQGLGHTEYEPCK